MIMSSSMIEYAYMHTAYKELMKFKTKKQFEANTSNVEVENMNSEDF